MSQGGNHITRKSEESSVTVPDSPSLQWLEQANEADLKAFSRSCGIPQRLLLPKGMTDGMEFALVVAVTDGDHDKAVDHPEQAELSHSQCGTHGSKYPDKRPMGYPLDRRIPDTQVFADAPNIKRVIVKVFHDESAH